MDNKRCIVQMYSYYFLTYFINFKSDLRLCSVNTSHFNFKFNITNYCNFKLLFKINCLPIELHKNIILLLSALRNGV